MYIELNNNFSIVINIFIIIEATETCSGNDLNWVSNPGWTWVWKPALDAPGLHLAFGIPLVPVSPKNDKVRLVLLCLGISLCEDMLIMDV